MSEVYTADVVKNVVGRYVEAVEAGASYDERSALVAEIADELGVKAASVRQKLVAEKVYIAKEKAEGSKGTAGASKAELAKAFGAIVGTDLASLEKASKADLQALWDYIVATSAQRDAENGI